MINTSQSPYSIIKECRATIHVFNRYGFSANNSIPLEQIEKDKFSDYGFFIDLLNSYEKLDESFINVFEHYEIPVLTDYLRRSHKYYLTHRLPQIETLISDKIAHGVKQPILNVLYEFFSLYKADLEEHFQEEEELVFPLADRLYAHQTDQHDIQNIYWIKSNKERALSFIESHKKEDSDIREINSAFLGYKGSAEELKAHEVLLKELNDFQKDLRIHAHIEDFVFSKKVYSLLKTFNQNLN